MNTNLSFYCIRDFDGVFLPRIDEVLYEDEFTDLPSGPDVGDYLTSEVNLLSQPLHVFFFEVFMSSDWCVYRTKISMFLPFVGIFLPSMEWQMVRFRIDRRSSPSNVSFPPEKCFYSFVRWLNRKGFYYLFPYKKRKDYGCTTNHTQL